MDIAVIGSNMVDLISYITRMPNEGETVEAPDFRMGCGGKGANQAVAAARLGSRVLMVSRVGNDMFADRTIENLAENGVDTRYVSRTEATSGVAPIFVDKESHNSIIVVKGANAKLSPADIENAAADIEKCQLIILQLEISLETVYAAIDFGRDHGIPVLLNPAPAEPELVLEKVKSVDYFVPNESELSMLTGMPVDTLADIENAAGALLDAGMKNVIVTMGERGVLWLAPGHEPVRIDATKVEARDTTGAGDAFIGCFAHYLVQTGDVRAAMKYANAYAGLSVTALGTQTSYATKDAFLNYLGE
ncbi:ribokinase [Neoactinobaculum massilliense]|uniref:ribokinase n=1 Tax=Neoactinobaculum massilliense TaxID=2364794 RepID=UPI000F52C803|nr:ribokinase [Neoactinobaculum massilliense]